MKQETPGRFFAAFLQELYRDEPLLIVETGCQRDLGVLSEISDGWSTLYIARWVREHPGCQFHSVDLNPGAIELARLSLEAEGLEKCCTFHRLDSLVYLSRVAGGCAKIDFAFLDSCDGLEHGLAEFELAVSAGARLIVMDDFASKVQLAWEAAKALEWVVEQVDRYSVMRRPEGRRYE